MTLTLPEWSSPNLSAPFLVDYGFFSTPALGGRHTRTDRPGNRFGVTINHPPLPSNEQGAQMKRRFVAAKTEPLRVAIHQGELINRVAGDPVVSADTDGGTTLSLSGLLESSVIREGQFFTLERGDDACLHMCAAEVIADAAGEATVQIVPPLRVIVSAGDRCEFREPYIVGIVEAERMGFTDRLDRLVDFPELTLVEAV